MATAMVGVLSPSAAQAETPTVNELVDCIGDPGGCIAARDAANWALGTAQWLYPESTLHNGAGDAFRHCIWSGALTQRIGSERSVAILNRHESASPDEPLDERVMDLGNNSIGVQIGSQADQYGGSDTWGWVISQCEGMQDADYLYGLGYDPSGLA